MSHDLRDGSGSNKAKVCGTRRRTQGVRRNRGIGRVKIELLPAKAERATTSGESDRLHIEDASVECRSRLDIANGKNEVVNAVNLHGDSWKWLVLMAPFPVWASVTGSSPGVE